LGVVELVTARNLHEIARPLDGTKGSKEMTDTDKARDTSPYRVALELTYEIAKAEATRGTDNHRKADADPRMYLLDLYAQCSRVVVRGWTAKQAIQESKE
jgi:hypothetical protein